MSEVKFRNEGGHPSDKVIAADEKVQSSELLNHTVVASDLAKRGIRIAAAGLGKQYKAQKQSWQRRIQYKEGAAETGTVTADDAAAAPNATISPVQSSSSTETWHPSSKPKRGPDARTEIDPGINSEATSSAPSVSPAGTDWDWRSSWNSTSAIEKVSSPLEAAPDTRETRTIPPAGRSVEILPKLQKPDDQSTVSAVPLSAGNNNGRRDSQRGSASSTEKGRSKQRDHTARNVAELVRFATDRMVSDDTSGKTISTSVRGAVHVAGATAHTARFGVWTWQKSASFVQNIRSFREAAKMHGLLHTAAGAARAMISSGVSGLIALGGTALSGLLIFLLILFLLIALILTAADLSFGVTGTIGTETLDALYSYVTLKDAELTAQINREAGRSGYDEVRIYVNGSEIEDTSDFAISTNVNQLLTYLQVANAEGEHTVDELKRQIDTIYDALYSLSTQSITETRTEQTIAHAGDSLGTVVTSAYCSCSICCGQWAGGPTASGVYPQANHTLAVDAYNPIVPIGTQIIMNGVLYTVEDTGNLNAYGVNFDVFFDSHQEALNWGHRSFEAFIAGDEGTEVPVIVTRTIDVLKVNLSVSSLYTWINEHLDETDQEYLELIDTFGAYTGYTEMLNPFGERHWTVTERYGSYANGTSIALRNYITVFSVPGEDILAPATGTASWSGSTVTITKTTTTGEQHRITLAGITPGHSSEVVAGEEIGLAISNEVTITYQINGSYVNPVFYVANSPAGGGEGIVAMALSQLGQVGGQPYWSWYGFDSRVEWCACFVSWCADQCGLLDTGLIPRYSLCTSAVTWFQSHGQWAGNGYTPSAGDIIFFDWDGDLSADHTGIVVSSDGATVYTVEGNSGDAVRQRTYSVHSSDILGYGLPSYSS